MSRPKKNDAEKKRIIIQFRVTVTERNTLKEYSKSEAMNVTDFIKARTFGKPPRTKMATQKRQIFIQLLGEISKIGSNVNQIAKVMNTQQKAFYSVNIKEAVIAETLYNLNALSSQVLNELHPIKMEQEGKSSETE